MTMIDQKLSSDLMHFMVHELHEKAPDANHGLIVGEILIAWLDHIGRLCPGCQRDIFEEATRIIGRKIADLPAGHHHMH